MLILVYNVCAPWKMICRRESVSIYDIQVPFLRGKDPGRSLPPSHIVSISKYRTTPCEILMPAFRSPFPAVDGLLPIKANGQQRWTLKRPAGDA